jgi:predicted membrane protein
MMADYLSAAMAARHNPALVGGETAMSTGWLLWGMVFGAVGLGFFVYGRRQKAAVPLVCGLALMIFPYFISDTMLLVAVGATLIALPYFVSI